VLAAGALDQVRAVELQGGIIDFLHSITNPNEAAQLSQNPE